jgi:alpha-galactosidase
MNAPLLFVAEDAMKHNEMDRRQDADAGLSPAFTFVYDGRPSEALLEEWQSETSGSTTTWTSPDGLVVRLETTRHDDLAVEWLLRFENTGSEPSGVIERVRCLDVTSVIPEPDDDDVYGHFRPGLRIYRSRGSQLAFNDFEYFEERIYRRERIEMSAGSGRSSRNWLPYLLTDVGGRGVVYGFGWSGRWICSATHTDDEQLHVEAGIEKLRLRLEPGEAIRGVRILSMPWRGERRDAHNAFRRLLRDHYTPRIDGEVVRGPFSIGHWGGMSTDQHLERIAVYAREKLPQEYLWLDAGWFGDDPAVSQNEFAPGWSNNVGDWRVNRHRHPDGLGPIVDAAAAAGMKTLLWVEPGRARRDSRWAREHPEWFLTAPELPGELHPDDLLLDYGNPAARAGVLEEISALIRECRLAVYREDFNIDPEPFWRLRDTPERTGITEIRYIEGHYQFWDALRERFPELIIDNCSSGGMLLDFEMLRRSVSLWRSDYPCLVGYDPAGSQAAGMNLSLWMPMHGTGTWSSMPTRETTSTYRVRSSFSPAFQMSSFVRANQEIQEDYPWDWFRKMGHEYLRCREFFTADYHPLTAVRASHETDWAAYQMNSPEHGAGFVMAFRRSAGSTERFRAQLRGLDPSATYLLDDVDDGTSWEASGEALAAGLDLDLDQPESSALVFYRRA